ncbi:MAG: chlorite dismutase family protein [Luteolibacter sp.]
MTANSRLFSFIGGHEGDWRATSSSAIAGDGLPAIERLAIHPGDQSAKSATWVLRGATSNERYVTRAEKNQLVAISPPLGRPEADCGVLIPIRKNAAWWAMTQDERRQVFEERSHHTQIGLDTLPAVARRLHHCRDLSAEEPFDFLTWFEFAAEDVAAFDQLLARLRDTEEWRYVEREVELRFVKRE